MILIIHKEGVEEDLLKLQKILELFVQKTNICIKKLDQISTANFLQIELVIILGGDGTTLRALSSEDFTQKYVLSINAGNIGFISSVLMDEAKVILQSYFLKKYEEIKMDKRLWLMTKMNNKSYKSLNEVSIYRGSSSKMLFIKAFFNGIETLQFRADGLIISTSTGSTAYNLSAGGPIVHSEIPSMIFNPICPYSLTLKPIVVSQTDRIKIEAKFHGQNMETEKFHVTFDGQIQVQCCGKTTLEFYLSENFVHFMKPKGEHYYTTLKKKIYWGRGLL